MQGLRSEYQEMLCPAPRFRERDDSRYLARDDAAHLWVPADQAGGLGVAIGVALEGLRAVGTSPALAVTTDHPADGPLASMRIDAAAMPHAQGFELTITETQVEIVGHDGAGVYYGVLALRQLARQSQRGLIAQRIRDWPAFLHRGFLLDISRDRVPTQESLYRLVDLLTEFRYNELQLYMEHTFAYPEHPAVWADASAMTGEQVRELDAYCRERHIELVPCQNSFGHMERWLKHEHYADLAEIEGGGTDLSPVVSGSAELVSGLHEELLRHFTSKRINVGCDEVHTLGQGRSRTAVESDGFGRVYLDYLMRLHEPLQARGCAMMFWGDMLVPFDAALRAERAELVKLLPDDVIPMVWGYRPDDPLAEQAAVYAAAGKPFYVCPGTSSWTSLIGRLPRMRGNVQAAVAAAERHSAKGMLMCDWSEHGWTPLPIMYPGLVCGAAMAWNATANLEIDLAGVLDTHVFGESAVSLGARICELGEIYALQGATDENIPPSILLLLDPDDSLQSPIYARLDRQGLEQSIHEVERILAELWEEKGREPASGPVLEELIWAGEAYRFSCRLLLARSSVGLQSIGDLPTEISQSLAFELEKLISEFSALWSSQSRPGGLKDSVDPFNRIIGLLRSRDHASSERVCDGHP